MKKLFLTIVLLFSLSSAMFQEKELLYWKAESKEQVTKVAYE